VVGERCHATRKLKTPPASEDTDGVFHAFTSFKVAALEQIISRRWFRSGYVRNFCSDRRWFHISRRFPDRGKYGSAATIEKPPRYLAG
jgi:hypothetical protein